LSHRAAEIEAALQRTAARYSELPLIESSILRLLALLCREYNAVLEQCLRPHGLSETDFRILTSLCSQPNGVAHPSDLCADAGQSPANMTRVTDALFERGLIGRVASADDRRRTILRVSAAGEALVHELLPAASAQVRALFGDLPPASRRTLLESLRALIAQLDARTQKP
jgi:MarR family transcriptional repressor of emrRAB